MHAIKIPNTAGSKGRFPFIAYVDREVLSAIEGNIADVTKAHANLCIELEKMRSPGEDYGLAVACIFDAFRDLKDAVEYGNETVSLLWEARILDLVTDSPHEKTLVTIPLELYQGRTSFPYCILRLHVAILQFGALLGKKEEESLLLHDELLMQAGMRQLEMYVQEYKRFKKLLDEYRETTDKYKEISEENE